MDIKDLVKATASVYGEEQITPDAAAPLPILPDKGYRFRAGEKVLTMGGPEGCHDTTTLRYRLQESISPVQSPVVPRYRQEISDDLGKAKFPPKVREKRVLVAIPCLNEEVAIGSLVLMARRHADEVLVVDDGCTDGTANVAREAGARVISHSSQQGKGRAVKTALQYAWNHHFDALVFMDGDGQHNPDEIPLLLEPIMVDSADLVIGYRKMTQMPVYRRFGRAVLDAVTGAGSTITDSQCGFRALNQRTIESLHTSLTKDDFSTESEMLQIAQEKKLRVGETPIVCKYGNFETSTKNPVTHGFEVLHSLFWLFVEKRPLLYIGVPGFGAVVAGVVLGTRFLQHYNLYGAYSVEYALLVTVFLIPGAVALILGLMLDIISRMRRRGPSSA